MFTSIVKTNSTYIPNFSKHEVYHDKYLIRVISIANSGSGVNFSVEKVPERLREMALIF
jgi:hypothetical protein